MDELHVVAGGERNEDEEEDDEAPQIDMDVRDFRAKLVAQQRAEDGEGGEGASVDGETPTTTTTTTTSHCRA